MESPLHPIHSALYRNPVADEIGDQHQFVHILGISLRIQIVRPTKGCAVGKSLETVGYASWKIVRKPVAFKENRDEIVPDISDLLACV
jgi:hypothetical protein